MKHINELINKAKSNIGKSDEVKEKSSGIINLIFHNLKLIFPAWRQNFKTEKEYLSTKDLWLESLIDEGITTQEQIERALKCARNHDSAFFPSIGQFVKWSKKEKPRVNEDAYKIHVPKLREHTVEEYADMAEGKASEIINNSDSNLTTEELLAKLK